MRPCWWIRWTRVPSPMRWRASCAIRGWLTLCEVEAAPVSRRSRGSVASRGSSRSTPKWDGLVLADPALVSSALTQAWADRRVVLVHDWLTGMRGGEKVLESLCRLFPHADLLTLVHKRGSVSPLIEGRK